MTERDQLLRIHTLLKEQRYDEARPLLKALPNNPTAQRWLAKLDELAPELDDPFSKQIPASPQTVLDLRISDETALFVGGQLAFWIAFFVLPWTNVDTRILQQASTGAQIAQIILNFGGLLQLTVDTNLFFLIPVGMAVSAVARIRWSGAGMLAILSAIGFVIVLAKQIQTSPDNTSSLGAGFWLSLVGCAVVISSSISASGLRKQLMK